MFDDQRVAQVEHLLQNVQQIRAADTAFAAILGDGSVVTWGAARLMMFDPVGWFSGLEHVCFFYVLGIIILTD